MGIDISIGWLTVIMFGSLLVLLMAGLPLAFVTGGLACVFLFVLGDAQTLNIVPSRIFPLMTNYQLGGGGGGLGVGVWPSLRVANSAPAVARAVRNEPWLSEQSPPRNSNFMMLKLLGSFAVLRDVSCHQKPDATMSNTILPARSPPRTSPPCARLIRTPHDQFAVRRCGHQWKPAWPRMRSRSLPRATHRSATTASIRRGCRSGC